jgi:hypothetical protein
VFNKQDAALDEKPDDKNKHRSYYNGNQSLREDRKQVYV